MKKDVLKQAPTGKQVVLDIATKASGRSEEKYRTILEDMKEGYWEIDLAGNLTFFNDAICRLLGYTKKELLGTNYRVFTAAKDADKIYKAFNQVYQTGKANRNMFFTLSLKDGGRRFAESSVFPRLNNKGEIIGFRGVSRDVTERRQAEEALLASEAHYRELADSITDVFFQIDRNLHYTYWNKASEVLTGMPAKDAIGKSIYEVFPDTPETRKVAKVYLDVIKTRQSRTFENPYRVADKDYLLEISAYPSSQGASVFVKDITKRKQAEEALQAERNKLQSLISAMEDGLTIRDTDYNLTYQNKVSILTSGDRVGEKCYRAIEGSENVCDGCPAEEAFRDGKSHTSVRRTVLPSGEVIFWENKANPIRDAEGRIVACLEVSNNITRRKQMEEALAKSEERYRTVLEQMGESYYEVDIAGNFTFFNDALCLQLGYSKEELMGMNFRTITPIDTVKEVFRLYNQVYRTSMPFKSVPFERIRKDGTRLFVESSIFPLRNDNGDIIGFRGIARDVSERMQIIEALKQSEERYRTILEDINDSYFEVDLAGNFTFANDSTCRHLKYSKKELIGLNYKDFTAAEDAETVYKTFNKVYQTGKPVYGLTWKIVRKGIGEGFAEAAIFPLRNEKGEIIGFRGIGRDITERLQMEKALRQSEERYRSVLEQMEEAYYEVDVAGNFTFFNDAMCRQMGYSREELMGMNYRFYTPKDDVQRMYKVFNRVYQTGKPSIGFPVERIKKDGARIFAEISTFPLRNESGKIIGFRGTIRDITERMQAEEALKESEEKFRTLSEESPNMIFINKMGPIVYANMRCEEVMGYKREKLYSQDFDFLTLIAPEFREQVKANFKRHVRGLEPKSLEYTLLTKEGRQIDAILSSKLIKYQKEMAILGIITDISEQKKAGEERKEMEQKAQLASRLACVGELASGVAHEINNPLTGVIGYAHLLLDRSDIPQDIRHDLEIINEGAQRVAGIVRKLLTFAGQQKPEQKLVNINEIISTTLDLRAYELASNNIKVTFQPAGGLPMTIADPGQLQQVFLNLIINAETEMKLAHSKGKLSIKTEHIDNTIRISFKDDGPGIAKENLERIFNPFFTTREVGQGTGLGLNLCHGIITEHKGRIWAESRLGRGATFFVELPIVTKDRQSALLKPPAKEPEKVTKAKILVIDDEPLVRQLASRVLSEEGHEVEAVDNAEDALKRIKSKRYSRILLDIKMPGTDGINLYEQFKEIAPSLKSRVVFVTGDVMGKRTTDFLAKTKAPYITKPFDAEQLKREINRILVSG
jgi:PAS domain S-box-containing protein